MRDGVPQVGQAEVFVRSFEVGVDVGEGDDDDRGRGPYGPVLDLQYEHETEDRPSIICRGAVSEPVSQHISQPTLTKQIE